MKLPTGTEVGIRDATIAADVLAGVPEHVIAQKRRAGENYIKYYARRHERWLTEWLNNDPYLIDCLKVIAA